MLIAKDVVVFSTKMFKKGNIVLFSPPSSVVKKDGIYSIVEKTLSPCLVMKKEESHQHNVHSNIVLESYQSVFFPGKQQKYSPK